MADVNEGLRDELLRLKEDFNRRLDSIISEMEGKGKKKDPPSQAISLGAPIETSEQMGIF